MIWEDAIAQAKEEMGIIGYTADWNEVVERAKQILSEEASKIAKEEHLDYLKSDEWKNKKENVLKRDKYRCQDCEKIIPRLKKDFDEIGMELYGDDGYVPFEYHVYASEVHHLDYQYKQTHLEEKYCISLCGNCHKLRHTFNSFGSNWLKKEIENNIMAGLYNKVRVQHWFIRIQKEAWDEVIKKITIKPMDWINEELKRGKEDDGTTNES